MLPPAVKLGRTATAFDGTTAVAFGPKPLPLPVNLAATAAAAAAWAAVPGSALASPLRPRPARVLLAQAAAYLAARALVLALVCRAFLRQPLYAPGTVPAASALSRYADVDGAPSVHYLECAASSGAGVAAPFAVHCNHGFGASSLGWLTALAPLAAATGAARAVAHDAPGFGLTARPPKRGPAYGTARNAAIGLGLLDGRAQPGPPLLVGHSMGALSSAEMALELAQRPATEEPVRVVLVAPALFATKKRAGGAGARRPGRWRRLLCLPARVLLPAALEAFLPVVLRALVYSPRFWLKGLRSAWGSAGPNGVSAAVVDRYRWPSLAADWDKGMARFAASKAAASFEEGAGGGPGRVERLAALSAAGRARVLIVHGAEDKVVPLANSRALAAELGAALVELSGVGHCPQEEDPDGFASVVGRWLAAS